MENLLQPLAKSALIPLVLIAPASTAGARIHKTFLGSGGSYDPNKEMEDIMKKVKSLGNSDLLVIDATQIIENETKEQRGAFLGMLLDTLDVSLLRNMSAGKGFI